jgi:hypothetical protein
VLNDEHPGEIDQTLQMDAGDVKEIVVHADGAQWVVEVVDVSGYVASSTHGRDLRENGPLANLCGFLVSISGFDISEADYY